MGAKTVENQKNGKKRLFSGGEISLDQDSFKSAKNKRLLSLEIVRSLLRCHVRCSMVEKLLPIKDLPRIRVLSTGDVSSTFFEQICQFLIKIVNVLTLIIEILMSLSF